MAGARVASQAAVKATSVLADQVWRPARGVVILLYHRVGARTPTAVDLPTALFDEQMAWLASQRLQVGIDDALTSLAATTSGPAPSDPDPVVVTFDDGTADLVEVVLPILSPPPDPGRVLPGDRLHRALPAVPERRRAAVVGGGARGRFDRSRDDRFAHRHPRPARPHRSGRGGRRARPVAPAHRGPRRRVGARLRLPEGGRRDPGGRSARPEPGSGPPRSAGAGPTRTVAPTPIA